MPFGALRVIAAVLREAVSLMLTSDSDRDGELIAREVLSWVTHRDAIGETPKHKTVLRGSTPDVGAGDGEAPARHPSVRPDRPKEQAGNERARRLLDVEQTADYLRLSPSTLNRLRTTGEGPPFIKVRRRVLYDVEALDTWLTKRVRRHTGESGVE